MILITVFSVLTLISSIVCSSLVFYNEKARTEANSNKVLASNNIYKNSTIIYHQNNTLNISSPEPGYSTEQTFSITNNNSNTLKYKLVWENITSTWSSNVNNTSHPEEFIYNITCSNGENASKTMPVNNEDPIILDNLELKTNKSNECSIKISFINNGQDQSYNLNKSFSGTYKLIIED